MATALTSERFVRIEHLLSNGPPWFSDEIREVAEISREMLVVVKAAHRMALREGDYTDDHRQLRRAMAPFVEPSDA